MAYETIYCRNCYQKIPANSKVCPECGEKTAADGFDGAPLEPMVNDFDKFPADEFEGTTLLTKDETKWDNEPQWNSEAYDATRLLNEEPFIDLEIANNSADAIVVAAKNGSAFGMQEKMSYLDFYETYTAKSTRSWVNAAYIVAFLSAVLALVTLAAFGGWLVLLDIVVFVGCGAMIAAKKNHTFSLVLMVYSILITLLNLFAGGKLTGIVALICCVMSTMKLNDVKNAYKKYCEEGVIPEKPI